VGKEEQKKPGKVRGANKKQGGRQGGHSKRKETEKTYRTGVLAETKKKGRDVRFCEERQHSWKEAESSGGEMAKKEARERTGGGKCQSGLGRAGGRGGTPKSNTADDEPRREGRRKKCFNERGSLHDGRNPSGPELNYVPHTQYRMRQMG